MKTLRNLHITPSRILSLLVTVPLVINGVLQACGEQHVVIPASLAGALALTVALCKDLREPLAILFGTQSGDSDGQKEN